MSTNKMYIKQKGHYNRDTIAVVSMKTVLKLAKLNAFTTSLAMSFTGREGSHYITYDSSIEDLIDSIRQAGRHL